MAFFHFIYLPNIIQSWYFSYSQTYFLGSLNLHLYDLCILRVTHFLQIRSTCKMENFTDLNQIIFDLSFIHLNQINTHYDFLSCFYQTMNNMVQLKIDYSYLKPLHIPILYFLFCLMKANFLVNIFLIQHFKLMHLMNLAMNLYIYEF